MTPGAAHDKTSAGIEDEKKPLVACDQGLFLQACAGLFHDELLEFLGWLMGLEPTTTGITIRDSTN